MKLDSGASLPPTVDGIQIFRCDSAAVYAALTPVGTWQWCDGPNPFHGSVLKRAQQHTFRQYTQKRDMKRIYANEPTRWSRYSPYLLAALTKIPHKSPRHQGRRTKHVFDWMAHGHNLSKGATPHLQTDRARANSVDTRRHNSTSMCRARIPH